MSRRVFSRAGGSSQGANPQAHKEHLGFVKFFPQQRGGLIASERIVIVVDFARQQLSVFTMPLAARLPASKGYL